MRKKITKILVLPLLGLASLGLLALSPNQASATNPDLINFQGKVVNGSSSGNAGTNVTDGSYSFRFCLYTTATPTTPCTAGANNDAVWKESKSLTVTSGVFQTELGDTTALPSFSSNSDLYLGVTFNSDAAGEMLPRIHLDSVPYALQADNSSTLGGLSNTNFVQLAQGLQTDGSTTNASIAINKTGATADILLLQANSLNALEVNNSGTVLLGQAGASGLNGTLLFNNSAGTHTVGLSLQADPGSSYTLLLPTTGPSTSQCLQTDGTTANQLVFGACGTGGASSLAASYTAGSAGDQVITLSSTNDSLIIRNPSSGGSDSGTTPLYIDQLATGTQGGLTINLAADSAIASNTRTGLTVSSGAITENTANTGTLVGVDITVPGLTTSSSSSAKLNAYGLRVTIGNLTQTAGTLTKNGIYVDSGSTTVTSGGVINGVNLNVGSINIGSYNGLNISTNGTSRTISGSANVTGINLDLSSNVTANGVSMTGISVRTPSDTDISLRTKTGISISPGAITLTSSSPGTYNGLLLSSPGPVQTSTVGAGVLNWNGASLAIANATANGSNSTLNANGLVVLTGNLTQTSGTLIENGLLVDTSTGTLTSGTLNGLKIGNITDPGAAVTSSALTLGTGWDKQINGNGWSVDGSGNISVASCSGCGGGGTLASTYNSAATTGNTINLATAGGGIIIKDSATSVGSAFVVQNSSSSSLLTADTSNMRLSVDSSYTFLGTGFGTPSVVDAGAGSLTSGSQYYYKITAIDSAGGETTASTEGTLGTGHTALTVSWTAITGAMGYRIYQSTSSGTETYYTTVFTNTFTDTGQYVAGITTPPSSNTAYSATNNSNTQLQLSVGANGSPTGQLYVSGVVPSTFTGRTTDGLSGPNRVYVQGRYAYVASESNHALVIYDVSNPAAPAKISSTNSPFTDPQDVYVQGKYAYICDFTNNSIYIFDISNPASPTQVGSMTTGLSAPQSVYVQGRYAYVASSSNSTLAIFDVSNPASPAAAGTITTNLSTPVRVYVQGNYAYVANQNSSTSAIFDVSNPASPSAAGTFNIGGGNANRYVVVQGRYAYSVGTNASNKGAFTINDVSNPGVGVSSPVVKTILGTDNNDFNQPVRISVQGRYAYIASRGDCSLVVFDISTPSSPKKVGSVSSGMVPGGAGCTVGGSDGPRGLFVQGRYAYMTANTANAFAIYDLGGSYIQQLESGGAEFGSVAINSSLQAAGDASIAGGLTVGQSLNVGNSFNVQSTSGKAILEADASNMRIGVNVTYSSMTAPTGLVVAAAGSGTGALAGTVGTTQYYYEVTAIDSAGGETAPSAESTPVTLTSTKIMNLHWTAVTGASGYKIYRSTATGAEVYLTTVLSNYSTITPYQDNGSITAGSATPPSSTTAYTSANNSSSTLQLSVGGLGTPTGQVYVGGILPKEISSGGVATGSGPNSVYVVGRYAYVVDKTANKLQVFDVSVPSRPIDVSAGGVTTASDPRSVFVSGHYAYVADYTASKLQVFDVSNPSAPADISSGGVTTGTNPLYVYVQGRYAYVVDYTGGKLQVFDVSNPTLPVDVSSGGVSLGNSGNGLYVSGKYAYVSVYESSVVKIFNISNPASPALTGTTSSHINSGYNSLYVTGHNMYVMTGPSGGFMETFDVSNPASPVLLGSSSAGSSVYVAGRYAYIVNSSSNKFLVEDISNPAAPFDVTSGGVSTGAGPSSVYVSGRYAYTVSTTDNKLQAFDLGGTYSQQLEAGAAEFDSLAVNSNLQAGADVSIIGGLNVGQSINVGNGFNVQNSSGISLFNVNSASTSITIGNSTNGVIYTASTFEPVLNGTARHTLRISLTPEYAGATMSGTGTGTMTSDNEAVSPFHNYYKWTTTQGTSQTYSVYVRVPIPMDFSAWCSSANCNPTIFLYTKNSGSSASSVQIATYDTANASVQALTNIASANTSWNENSVNAAASAKTWTPGGYMTLQIQMSAISSSTTQIGELRMDYLSRY
jgi:hypothetical protein